MIAIAVCVVACAALVYAEWTQHRTLRIAAKTIASLAFLAVGVLAMTSAPERGELYRRYAQLVIAGLALGVAGDLALLGHGNRAFLAGLGAFLAGHVAYVAACAQIIPVEAWLSRTGVFALAPVAVAGIALWTLWPRLGSMKGAVVAYVAVIVLMVIGAGAVAHAAFDATPPSTGSFLGMFNVRTSLPDTNRLCLGAGAILFFASDLAVARDKFVGTSFANKAWGLPAYYAGQLLIALSLQ